MLYIVAGPSGAGKTTFIKLVQAYAPNCTVVPVDVFSISNRKYKQNPGRKKVSLLEFVEKLKKGSILACVSTITHSMALVFLRIMSKQM